MLYSSSSYICANSAKYGYDGAYYLKLQLRNYIIGAIGMVFFIAVPTFLFVAYFVLSPLFGYVELREDSLFIKFGFFLSREIPYSKIRRVERDRKFYSESMLSLKSALEHVNVGYGSFDVVTVSVLNNDELVRELELRCGAPSE